MAEIKDKVIERMTQLANDIAASIARHGLTASGATARSLKVVDEGDEVALYGRTFFPALETGSANWTGYTGIHCTFYEFREIIRRWATAKGLNFGQAKDYDKAVGAITSSIIRRGTAQKRSGVRLDVYTSLIDQAVADIGEIIMSAYGEEITNHLEKWRTE